MTTPIQSSIWSPQEAAKIEQAAVVAKEMRNTMEKTVRVLSQLPQIDAAYPLLSACKSILRGISPRAASENALELEKIVTEILHGNSIKANFGKLGKLLIPLANKDVTTFTSEEFLDLKEVLQKWITYSKNPEILDLLKNPTLCAEFFQTNEVPNEITDEYLKSELKCYEQCYEAACQCIMLTHIQVLNEQKHLSTVADLYKIAGYSLLIAQALPDENYPGGVVAAVHERERLENEIVGINRVLTNSSIIQGTVEKAQKVDSLVEQLMKSDDPETVKSVARQMEIKQFPIDIRLKLLKVLAETGPKSEKYKAKTLKFVDSLLKTPKM